jgi:LEA14-like dessication related protein
MPQIKVKGVKISKLSFTSAELLTQVEVNNPNAFNLAMSNLNYQLNINNQKWGEGNIAKTSNIPEKGKGVIDIPVKLDLVSVGQAAYKVLLNKSTIEYELTGNATVDTGLELLRNYKMPLDVKGKTSLQ